MTPVTHLYPDAPPPDGLPSVTVADRAGISYRQLNFWLDAGHITCSQRDQLRATADHAWQVGSGYPRVWTPAEAAHVARVANLVRAGFLPHRAAEHARTLAEQDTVRVGHGLTLLEAGT